MTESTRKSASGGQEARKRKHWKERVATTGYGMGAKMLMTGPELLATIASSNWDHYVYGLCDPDGYTFYVGKGVRDRALAHATDAENGCNSEKSEAIRSLGEKLRYTIYLQCQDDTFALGYEACLINAFHDVLTNVVIPSDEVIDRMFIPVDPMMSIRKTFKEIDAILEKGDLDCRRSMLSIISGCPEILPKISNDDLAWVMGMDDGAAARASIEKQLETIKNGSQ